MAHLIGERHPRRPRRKIKCRLRRAALIGRVFLHAIVQLQHERVVRRARRLRDAQQTEHGPRTGPWHAQRGREVTADGVEAVADAPRPRLAVGVDVRKHAKNPASLRRRRWKCIDVQARVVLAPRRRAAGNLDRAKARPASRDVRGIGRARPLHERERLVAEARQHPAQHLRHLSGHRAAAHLACGGIETDVLTAGQDAWREQGLFVDLDREETGRLPEYIARFEQGRPGRFAVEPANLRSHSENDSNT